MSFKEGPHAQNQQELENLSFGDPYIQMLAAYVTSDMEGNSPTMGVTFSSNNQWKVVECGDEPIEGDVRAVIVIPKSQVQYPTHKGTLEFMRMISLAADYSHLIKHPYGRMIRTFPRVPLSTRAFMNQRADAWAVQAAAVIERIDTRWRHPENLDDIIEKYPHGIASWVIRDNVHNFNNPNKWWDRGALFQKAFNEHAEIIPIFFKLLYRMFPPKAA